MNSLNDRPSVFLDSSVLISALISKTGASAAILEKAQEGLLEVSISDYVTGEVKDVFSRKMPQLFPVLS